MTDILFSFSPKMEEEEEKTKFTYFFDVMMYLGFWIFKTDDRRKKLLYLLYSFCAKSLVAFMSLMGILDFFDSIPNMNKVIYNVCINIFLIGTFVKTILTAQNGEKLNILRRRLHRSIKTCKDKEELQLYDEAVKDLDFIKKLFYLAWVMSYPSWMVLNMMSGYWGERTYPLPSRWPTEVDKNDSKAFYSISLFHGACSAWFLVQALSLEMSMFALLTQIHREYRFLIKRIREFGEFCDDLYMEESGTNGKKDVEVGEPNVILKRAKVKQTLKEITIRQKHLFEFSEDFEYGFNKSMFVHLFAGGTLLCMNGIQAMIFSFHFSINMVYQFGYVLIIMIDILYLCWMTDKIAMRCYEVGFAFYSIPWYKLDLRTQKDISFVILRSQRAPRITSGGLAELNLRTSMVVLKNLYSMLAMFRQVALK